MQEPKNGDDGLKQEVFEIDKEIKIQGFIVKPYQVKEVVEKVKKILG